MRGFMRLAIQWLTTVAVVLLVIFILNKIAFTRNFVQMALK